MDPEKQENLKSSKSQRTEKPETATRRAAMDLLARREHSFLELTQKLSPKFSDEDVKPVIARLRDENLQSDQRYLEAYIRFRLKKGFGSLKIEAELYSKGMDSEHVRAYLYNDENDWVDLCRQALHKKFPVLDVTNLKVNMKERAKCQRFLIQRGFTSDTIRDVIMNVIES